MAPNFGAAIHSFVALDSDRKSLGSGLTGPGSVPDRPGRAGARDFAGEFAATLIYLIPLFDSGV